MPIIGINFDKISVEKRKPVQAPLNIGVNVKVLDMEKEEMSFSTKDTSVLRINFAFQLKYEPKIADLTLAGHLHFMEDKKAIEDLMNRWKKEKKMDPNISKLLLNAVLVKCHTKALYMAQEVNLPPHIRMPILENKGKQ